MLEDLLPGKGKGRESWRGSESGERKGGIGGGGEGELRLKETSK